MIYTVTLNPAMDCVMQLDDLVPGRTNRASGAFYSAGGKGINVSRVLRSLGTDSILTGFLAGFTGMEIERQLTEQRCKCDFVKLEEGCTRINVKIKGKEETEINGTGVKPQEEEVIRLMRKLEKAEKGDVIVLAGSIPKGLDPKIYEEIMKNAR